MNEEFDFYSHDPYDDARLVVIFMTAGMCLIIGLIMIVWRLCCMRSTARSQDRQGNVFTIHDESTRESRYNDIFFIEPNSAEAARIRAQLEKDDKDLPSYEEVMRMTSVTSTTPANTAAMTASNASVNTAETRLSVPPYSEVDPNASSTSLHAVGNATTINSASAATPTTQTQSTPPPPLFAAAVVSSSVTQATLNV
ncbi:uncharacterized protein LOC106096145 isoform X9 [Stomoxys calcitrans]|uniref:Uncharacterized protein n=1 Tax=Stomoxys calcitrans TaxID=35570 RepID=A0A1I8P451_STOCA|nr:uncharacterized protein LOC106096145 isoform X9 [Stomoxys calcitrans]